MHDPPGVRRLPFARSELDALAEGRLLRVPPVVVTGDGVRGRVDGREAVLFCGNDYLALRHHPRVIEGAARALREEGAGSGSSRLVAGTLPCHLALEAALAERFGAEAALLFASGYHANLAVLGALTGEGDLVASDALDHASLIDGCRLSRARTAVFAHADPADLAARLDAPARRRFVVTEGLFSMDGDVAPLGALLDVAERAGAHAIVDDAHGLGVLGPTGGGAVEEAGLLDRVPVRTGTLGKALGSHGAFVLCDPDTRELLLNRGRTFVFTTGLPPAACGAALAALALLDDEPWRRERALALAGRLRDGLRALGLDTGPSARQIVPVMLGTEARALALAAALLRRGVYAQAIRPPTVPRGTSRIRFTLSAGHSRDDVDRALDAVSGALAELPPLA
ncbi:8-amino-7-oxononanoate synthase [Myxococcota bacterium]|nr:8-amino-7-oxononanoate synthase [Myxococcota bacterium]